MMRGDWTLNGSTIVFDSQDTLADGQKRLLACVNTNTPFESVVVWGVPPKAFATIDTGQPRSNSDILHIGGHTENTKRLTTAVLALMAYRDGGQYGDKKYPRHDVLAFAHETPELLEWVNAACAKGWTKAYAPKGLAPLTWCGPHTDWVGARIRLRGLHGVVRQFWSSSPVLAFRGTTAVCTTVHSASPPASDRRRLAWRISKSPDQMFARLCRAAFSSTT